MNSPIPDVIVIGGGLSGLSTAADLASRGLSVFVLERHQHLGGRAYSFIDESMGEEIDNGQHLMMGCYHETRWLLRTIGSDHLATLQPNLHIDFRHPEFGATSLHCPPLPVPFHLLAGLLSLKTLSLPDRLKLLRVGLEIHKSPETIEPSIAALTVHQWLDSLGQSEANKKHLWDIIAVGSLNGAPKDVSAVLFYRVLRAAFLGGRENSSFLIPRVGLSRLFDEPIRRYVESKRGDVLRGCAVDTLISEGSRVKAVRCSDGVNREAAAFVSAVPWYALSSLLPPNEPAMRAADHMTASGILSINLWFDAPVMDEDFVALLDSTVQWVFNRSKIQGASASSGQCLALTVSGANRLIDKEASELVALAVEDLRRVFPRVGTARVVRSIVLKEKRATFSQRPDVEPLRPPCITSMENLFLAGDWTNTGYPATIEGAVMSGRKAAAAASAFLQSGK
ncbi:MAG: hydroxysqualene dehydroxylase HpnE [Ignavibacteriales bacterium]|nr:hydroxysqualene dehydroxylase HpnE [Ignavibacteriales bacterium]